MANIVALRMRPTEGPPPPPVLACALSGFATVGLSVVASVVVVEVVVVVVVVVVISEMRVELVRQQ